MEVRFLKLINDHEHNLESKVTGKKKEDYIGQIGRVIHIYGLQYSSLRDVEFKDGQVWCLDTQQFEEVKND